MRRLSGPILLILLVCGVVLAGARARNHDAVGAVDIATVENAQRDTVTRIHDGDTFYTVAYPKGIRIIGADTPEITNNSHGRIGCWGAAATERLRQLLPPTGPVLLILGQDTTYDRALATVETVDRVDVALVLIEEGLATVLTVKPNVEHAAAYQAAQARAQAAHLGEWSGTNPPGAPKGCVNPPQPKESTR